jgi:hypothetical protein
MDKLRSEQEAVRRVIASLNRAIEAEERAEPEPKYLYLRLKPTPRLTRDPRI